MKYLDKYLEEKLKIKVDLLDFNHALIKLDISEMENTIKII